MRYAAWLLTAGLCPWAAGAGEQVEVVKVTAQMFRFTPSVIALRKGKPVILEIRSLDRLHGFNVPALGIRRDLIPGEPVQVRITPQQSGELRFLCDVFCGGGHEAMGGRIVVGK
jgi:cytochrome c oxidase subunit 2